MIDLIFIVLDSGLSGASDVPDSLGHGRVFFLANEENNFVVFRRLSTELYSINYYFFVFIIRPVFQANYFMFLLKCIWVISFSYSRLPGIPDFISLEECEQFLVHGSNMFASEDRVAIAELADFYRSNPFFWMLNTKQKHLYTA